MTESIWTSTRRSAGVTCAAALAVLGSSSALFVWGSFLLGILNSEPDAGGKHIYDLHPSVVLFIATVPSFLIVYGIWTGIGLFQLKPWARRAALAWASVALCFGLSIVAFRPFETFFIPDHFVSELESLKQLLAISLVFATLPVGVWWIFFFRLASVKRQFEPEAESGESSSR